MRFKTLAEWLAWQETLHPKAIDLGLLRVAWVWEALRPAEPPPITLTVGGTNGKGSCVAMLDAILREAGYRVGTYTSPHILRYNERIRIDGLPVEDARIVEAFARVDQARGETSLSFFEFGTLAALDIFAREPLDVRVLEVGLGGRLDAVNIVDADVAVIACIDIDHREWLGTTREAIGLEKAGIFRAGHDAVIGDPDVPVSVLRFAESRGVRLNRLGHEFGFEDLGDRWTWHADDTVIRDLPLPAIPGQHQLMNAAAALMALWKAADRLPVPADAIRRGLAGVRLPGRFQLFPGDVSELLDVAHNPQAVGILAEHIRRNFPGRRVHAVFAVMRDKDIEEIIGRIRDAVDCWYLAPLRMARAAEPAELRETLQQLGAKAVQDGFQDTADALAGARRNAQNGDLILVFGSFFLVSEYLALVARPEELTEWMNN
jgi:dihydrofolate synthase/folylpolyglutamate synthase